MQTNFQYNPEEWQPREEQFCPKYPNLIGGTENLIACLNHKETDAEVLIQAGCLEDLNKLIAYFANTHKNTSNGYKSLLFIRSNAGRRVNEDSLILQKEKPAPETVKPLNTHDYRDVMAILREAGNKQFSGIIAYLSKGAQHVLQTVTNGYLIAEVSITGEVNPIMQFKSKKALHKYFGL
jgi:hypothetical protein